MRFHVCTIEQDLRWGTARSSERRKGVFPNALRPPAHKPIVERFMRAIVRRGTFPSTLRLHHLDDAADHPSVINPRNATRIRRKKRLKALKLLVR